MTRLCLAQSASHHNRIDAGASVGDSEMAIAKFLETCTKDNSMDLRRNAKAQRGCLTCCLQVRNDKHHVSAHHRRILACIQIYRLWKAFEGAPTAPEERATLRYLVKLKRVLTGSDADLLRLVCWPDFLDDEHNSDSALVHLGARLWLESWAQKLAAFVPLQGPAEETALLTGIKKAVQKLQNPQHRNKVGPALRAFEQSESFLDPCLLK
jgi:hypothetical protein